MEQLQKTMIGHGLLVILVAMLAGFMLMFQLIGGLEYWPGQILPLHIYGTSAGWVRAHSGGTMNGLLVIVIALALPHLNLSERLQKWTAYGFLYVAWSFTLFYWLGNAAGNRGLTLGDSQLGKTDTLSVLAFLPGLPSVIIVVVLLGIGAKSILAARHR